MENTNNDSPYITLDIKGNKRWALAGYDKAKNLYWSLLPAAVLLDSAFPAGDGTEPDVQGHLATFDKDGKLLGVQAMHWGVEGGLDGFYPTEWPTKNDSVYNAVAAKTYAPQVFKQVKRQEIGGSMNYSQYLQDGGAAPQQGGDIQQQVAALVQAAMGGDEKANQQIQQIMQAAQQGDSQAQQLAQMIQAVAEQMQGQAESMKCGGKVKAKVKKKEVGGFVRKAAGGCPCQLKRVGGRLIEVDGCTGLPVKRKGGRLIPFGENALPGGLKRVTNDDAIVGAEGEGYTFTVNGRTYYIKPGENLLSAHSLIPIYDNNKHLLRLELADDTYMNGLDSGTYNTISSYLNYLGYKDKYKDITPEYNENFRYFYSTDHRGQNPTYAVQDMKNHIMYRNGKAYKIDTNGNVGAEITDYNASNWDYNTGSLKLTTPEYNSYGQIYNPETKQYEGVTYGQRNAAKVGWYGADGKTGATVAERKAWMKGAGKDFINSLNLGFTADQYTGTAAQNRALFEGYKGYNTWKAQQAAAADPNAGAAEAQGRTMTEAEKAWMNNPHRNFQVSTDLTNQQLLNMTATQALTSLDAAGYKRWMLLNSANAHDKYIAGTYTAPMKLKEEGPYYSDKESFDNARNAENLAVREQLLAELANAKTNRQRRQINANYNAKINTATWQPRTYTFNPVLNNDILSAKTFTPAQRDGGVLNYLNYLTLK